MEHISEAIRQRAKELVSKMTLEEKARLHAGMGAWHTNPVERLNFSNILLTDGPHGLRKEKDETKPMTQENTIEATCFPAAVANSCSFDRDLLFEMGQALGEECLQEEVNVILGPAANIKRSPLCGRNFEYISEDPCVAGECAAALINGIQSKNVGTSLKHFLANNQETARLSSSSVIDDRALREMYLSAFETAVKKSQPYTMMCSYNRINGTYASNNKRFMNDILRTEWGYEGLVMTDWGAMADRAESVKAGIDLEMPGRIVDFDMDIIDAIHNGKLEEAALDTCIEKVVALVLQTNENKKQTYDRSAHHDLARRIARESAVLLRNENNTLPLRKNIKIAVCGAFAQTPRYQGAGSSLINPYIINSPLDELKAQNIRYTYSEGVNLNDDKTNPEKLEAAINAASANDIDAIVAFVGLPDIYESEGYDREHILMPESHNRLIDELTKLGKPVIAVIMAGSAVEIPWRDSVDSILLMNLSGQNVGGAAFDLLFGDYSPCGKLTETYPLSLSDTPSNATFGDMYNVEYRESVFVGYRYYDTAQRKVAYPFGHGLSYADFAYSNLRLSSKKINDTDELKVTATIENKSNIVAKEIVQLYIKAPASAIFRPAHELRDFSKIELQPYEKKQIEFTLSKRAFSYYNTNINDWHVITGEYTIELAASSRDIRLTAPVQVSSTVDAKLPDYRDVAPAYYNLPQEGELVIPHEQFAELFQDKTPLTPRPIKPFNMYSTLHDLETGFYGRKLVKMIVEKRLQERGISKLSDEYYNAPMCSTMFPYRGMTREKLQGMILYANGHILKGKRLLDNDIND